ncbi:MAG: polysaccharide deacetylase family protein [Clostridia bacterium]|nr:polysaccharide deacetylase family protein [Clostridia bacterium]
MKNKVIAVVTNIVICTVIVVTAVVGLYSGNAVTVSDNSDNVYYSSSDTENGVSLMFNVYQNTEIVYGILDVLDEYGAKATFFIGGCWADDNVDCVREIYSRGHEVASHGYFHKDHSAMDYEQNLAEIEPSVRLLNMICGTEISLFAPPSGAYGEYTVNACVSLGLKVIMWSRDTIDWRDSDADLIISRATNNLQAGEFVLMHPTQSTLEALPSVLSYIGNTQLEAVTVSQCLGE